MIAQVKARYENGALTPLEPLNLEDGAEVTVSVEDSLGAKASPDSAENYGESNGGLSLESRGEAIYEDRIRRQVEGMARGTVVVIDVESGDYEADLNDASATARLTARRPGAVTYAVRIGHPAVYRMGARFSLHRQ